MCKFILEFDNKKYIEKYTINEDNTKHITLYTFFKNTIDKKHLYDFTNNIKNYYFIKDNKLIHPDITIKSLLNNNNENNNNNNENNYNIYNYNTIIHIQCHRKLKGGGILGPLEDLLGIVTDIINIVGGIFSIIPSVLKIADVFMILLKFFEWLGKFVLWFVQFLLWLFFDLLHPLNFFTDFFNTLIVICYSVFNSVFTIFMALMSFSVNIMGGFMQGFWGWDQSSLTYNDKNSNYFKKLNRNKGKKCYLTNRNTIPFSVVLGTILCPPIGVFMDMGITGWLNILICVLLTFLFYIPGLVYALLIIYS